MNVATIEGGALFAEGAALSVPIGGGLSFAARNSDEIVDFLTSAANRVHLSGGKSFVSTDPGVPELLKAIDSRLPGSIKQAEINVFRPNGTPFTDIDIVTNTHAIQVKLGTGKGIVNQLRTSQSVTNLDVVGFDAGKLLGKSSNFKPAVLHQAEREGFKITNDIEELIQILEGKL